jgi:hypothetical protein
MEDMMIKKFIQHRIEEGKRRQNQVEKINDTTVKEVTRNKNQFYYQWDTSFYQFLQKKGYQFQQMFAYSVELNGAIKAYNVSFKKDGVVYRFPIECNEKFNKMEMKGWYGNGEIRDEKSFVDFIFTIPADLKKFFKEFIECVTDYFVNNHPSIRIRVMAKKAPLTYNNIAYLLR